MSYERAFMEGTLDVFDFVLAEKLHMTVARLQAEMSNDEFVRWRAFDKYRNAMIDLEMKKQKAERARH